jgi:3',5'-cyclic AMP phosphodiesterase CpdA
LRTIAHLSDLHFGRLDRAILPALIAAVEAAEPDVVAVCGDLTQRARRREFEDARKFLDNLPSPQIVVPGNHDVPLYNVVARALRPLARYRRIISDDLEPFYADDEIAVAGVNTARSLTFDNGRINRRQVAGACARLAQCGAGVTRIIVTHHPFDAPDARGAHGILGRARMAMAEFAYHDVDLILSGHLHLGGVVESAARYEIPGRSLLLIQAGSAASTRLRGAANSFNLIRVERPHVSVERLNWNRERDSFALAAIDEFQLTPDGWARISGDRTAPHR